MALTARHASGIKKNLLLPSELGEQVLFIPGLRTQAMTFSTKITTPISSDNLRAHIENLPKAAGKWAFLATLESGK